MEISTSSSFGELLRLFRKRQRLTQYGLAERVGVHGNTIGIWERGEYLPESRTIVLEVARQLGLDEQETRSLLEASLTVITSHWAVPFHRNPYFTGRENLLSMLHTCLHPDQATTGLRMYALQGLGGVGKTQIVLEYAYRHANTYHALFWIDAETEKSILTSFERIATLLRLPEHQQADQQHNMAAVQRWLSNHARWLLIWDNLKTLEQLSHLLPPVRAGAMLITTRSAITGTLAQGIEVPPLEIEEGRCLLWRRAKRAKVGPQGGLAVMRTLIGRGDNDVPGSSEEDAAVTQLVREMGGLPLALDQVGAYIEEAGCSFSYYLRQYKQEHYEFLSRRGAAPTTHPASVAGTISLACQHIAQKNRAAVDLLRYCAFLSPEAIPEEIFVEHSVDTGEQYAACSLPQVGEALAVLHSLSLIQRHPETYTFSLHRLVQVVLREQISAEERLKRVQELVIALNACFPSIPESQWSQCERLLPHVLCCADQLPDHPLEQALADLLWKAGTYLLKRVQYQQAEACYRRAIRLRELGLGEEHPLVAFPLTGLARLLMDLGNYEQSEAVGLRSLQIREQALGSEHPLLVPSLIQLLILYYNQGRYEPAEALGERAMHILEQAEEPTPFDKAHLLNNISLTYWKTGKYEQAIKAAQGALSIWEHQNPPSVHTAGALSNLAIVYREIGQYDQAAETCLRALSFQKQMLGPEHPWISIPLNNMADIYIDMGRYEQAITLYQQSRQIWEQAYGPDHPDIAIPTLGLANAYRDSGQFEQAEPLYQDVMQIRETHLGLFHPETAETLQEIAHLRKRQGRQNEASLLAEQALTIYLSTLGDSHPQTVAAQTLLTQLQEEQEAKIQDTELLVEATVYVGSQKPGNCQTLAPRVEEEEASSPTSDPVQAFLDACCCLSPLATCRISELWSAYEQWTASVQNSVPLLSRREFAAQMKARGCRPGRTNTARIWRGIKILQRFS
ncbi:helix-turn-helix domain-containing protein [Ktedonosporobacter rubrisoli]|uniref:Helix-turn-helix domain-containing protein n=1 Tax=Ktedonosporobacter rubrisoli TaxID=2509675 RepID=A0A4P6K3I9_KTERU|nr:helix-turn-helix domain-containing protein [Ktedonosporobacter rubrisoli]QBD82827.1 helix-turn-helix domain-containing protein [Ktedonosporobacter rubrisoli]